MKVAKDKVVLAYSGGLDTSVAVKWLEEEKGLAVVALIVDVGQKDDLEAARDRALSVGAIEARIIDAREEFANDYVVPALQGNALYEGEYPLVSALSRPLIARWMVAVAQELGARYVAHGCTGKGNDQVRFEVSLRALDPSLEIIAPMREWTASRDEALDYARKKGIPVPVTKKSPYSIDENIWGRTIEGGVLEDLWGEPPEEAFTLTKDPALAPQEPEYLEVSFEAGIPRKLGGDEMPLLELLEAVTRVAGGHGFGRIDMVENRLVGIKSREVYEVPAALALIAAHRDLESLTLERDLMHYKALVAAKYAELIYNGFWFSPLKRSLEAFIAETQAEVVGKVRLKLFKGDCRVVGRNSPRALYRYDLATYTDEDTFSHEAAEGFVELWGLPVTVWARRKSSGKDDNVS